MDVLATLAMIVLVWLAGAAVGAALVSVTWPWVQLRITRWHGNDASRVALVFAMAPLVLPSTLVLLALAPGLAGIVHPGLDHCTLHPAHPHLCLAHPAAALPPPVALSVLASSGFALLALGRVRRQESVAGAPLWLGAGKELAPGVRLVPSEHPFAFTCGLIRAQALVSTGLLRALQPAQVKVVIAHEAAHVRRRDPLRHMVAHLASLPIWPSVRRALLAELRLCAERACDERAAQEADRVVVAETILRVERLLHAADREPSPVALGIGGSSVAVRVRVLLRTPQLRHRGWGLGVCGTALLAWLATGRVHHELEHLLAMIPGVR